MNLWVTDVLHYFGSKISVWTTSGTLVGGQLFGLAAPGWTDTTVSTPFQLLAGVSYCIAVYSAGQTDYGLASGLSQASPLGTIGMEYEYSGDHFPTMNPQSSNLWFVDILAHVGALYNPLITPTTATFTNGVWTGNMTVSQTVTGMCLHLDDGAGHPSNSNVFDVHPRKAPTATVSLSSHAPLTNDLLTATATKFGHRWKPGQPDLRLDGQRGGKTDRHVRHGSDRYL